MSKQVPCNGTHCPIHQNDCTVKGVKVHYLAIGTHEHALQELALGTYDAIILGDSKDHDASWIYHTNCKSGKAILAKTFCGHVQQGMRVTGDVYRFLVAMSVTDCAEKMCI
jgi:hypothetical protein